MVRLADIALDLDVVRKLRPGGEQQEALAIAHEYALRSFAWFIRLRFYYERRKLIWQPYMDVLCEAMELVTQREIRRLMVNMPPRALKSETITQSWQAWMIAKDDSPRSSVVSASYGLDLAERDSFKTRAVLQSDWFKLFAPHPILFRRDTQSNWETKGGAARACAGTGGAVTGKGGDHLIGDDLLKPLDANSEIKRQTANDWYGEVLRSRLNDPATGTITITAQRLHEQDVCGMLLEKQKNPDADQWHHINLPLIAEKPQQFSYRNGRTWSRKTGDCLNPARWPDTEVRALRVMLGPNFEGQYQQRPTKEQGGMLQPARLLKVQSPATELVKRWGLRVALYIDLATKEKQTVKDDPDYTVIVAMAKDQLGRIWILEIWREQCAMDRTAAALLDMMARWRPSGVAGERIGLHHAFKSVLTLTCRLRKRPLPYLRDIGIQDSGDKVQKAGSFAGLLNMGLIGVPAAAPWLPELEREMRSFPLGAHDDQVDPIALGCDDLQSIPEGEAPPAHRNLNPAQIDGNLLALARKRQQQLLGEPDGPEDTWD